MNTLPARSVRAAIAGVEAAVLAWLTTALLAMVAYAATAAAPGLGDSTWGTAVGVGAKLWALGLGGHVPVEDGTFTLIPLGVTLLAFWLLRGSLARAALTTLPQVAVAGGAFVVAVALLGLVSGVTPGLHLLGALAVAALAGWATLGSERVLPAEARTRLASVPGDAWEGARAGRALVLGLALLGAVLVLAAVAVEFPRIAEINGAVSQDIVSTIVMALVQVLYLPNLALWAASWAGGPGFMIGTGTSFAPTGVHTEPLPAIPVLGALPAPGVEPGLFVIAAPIVVGVLVAFWMQRRRPEPAGWAGVGWRVLGAFASAYLILLVALWLASGGIGPGRMADLGIANPLLVALVLAAELAGGYALMLAALRLIGTRGERPARASRRSATTTATASSGAATPASADESSHHDVHSTSATPATAATAAETFDELDTAAAFESADDAELPEDLSAEAMEYEESADGDWSHSDAANDAAQEWEIGADGADDWADAATAPTALTALTAVTAPTAYTAEVPADWDEDVVEEAVADEEEAANEES